MKKLLFLIIIVLGGTFIYSQDDCMKMPVEKGTIGSLYGYRIHPNTKTRKFHAGIDIKANYGSAVYAAFDGVVVEVRKNNRAYGNTIKVLHENGLISFYAHLSYMKVKKGDIVCKGQTIGKVGATGNATGPHLHFEIREEEKKVNPLEFL